MSSDKNMLLEMGFPENRVAAALLKTRNAGLQPAIDWLSEHADREDSFFDQVMSAAGRTTGSSTAAAEQEADVQGDETGGCLVCDECGKKFRDASKAQFHGYKTGHVAFSQSTETMPELTAEEKASRLAELKARLAEKRKAQASIDKKDAIENERIRRKHGQEAIEAKEREEQKEMERLVAARRAEKQADRIAKAKIKAQIEADKAERARQRAMEKEKASAALQEAPPKSVAPTVNVDRHAQARLQVRFPDGVPPYTNTFEATVPFSVVLEGVKQHRQDKGGSTGPGFTLNMNFPRATYSTADAAKTLKELKLVPSAALQYKPS